MDSFTRKSLHAKDVNKFAKEINTVADLIRRLQKMPQNMKVVDIGKAQFEDVYVAKKCYDDGHEEDVVVVY